MSPANKIPRIFRKPLAEKRYRRRILGRIYITEDREFLEALYSKDESGNYIIKTDLSTDEIKRLRGLAKSIKANAGIARKGRLIILGVLVGVILIFNLVFKNWLAELAAERALESVFIAQADVRRMRVSLVMGHIAFDHLQVADRKRPMKNLFELGKTEIAVNTLELLKGKVVAENIECQDIMWNTPRETSGRLPWDRESALQKKGSEEKASPTFGFGLPKIDVQKLIEEQAEALKSKETAEQINRQLEEIIGNWSTALQEMETKLQEVGQKVDEIGRINPQKIGSIPEAQAAVAAIGEVYPAVESLQKETSGIRSDIADDRARIDATYRQIKDALEQDYDYLQSFIGSPENTAKALVSSVASDYLKTSLGNYYGYALQAMALAENLKSDSKKPARPRRRAGVDVPFPTLNYPKFLIENLAASLGDRSSSQYIEGSLQYASSNPDLTNQPTSFQLSQRQGKQSLGLKGAIDTRSTRTKNFEVEFKAAGYGFAIGEGLDFIGLRSVKGIYAAESDFALDRENAADGLVALTLSEIDLKPLKSNDPIATTLADVLGSASSVIIKVHFKIDQDGNIKLTASSNIDKLVSDRIGAYLNRLVSDYQDKLRDELTSRIGSAVEQNETLSAAFKELEKAAEGNLTDIGSYRKVLDTKKKELEDRVKGIQKQAEQKARGEVEKAVDKAKDKIKLPF